MCIQLGSENIPLKVMTTNQNVAARVVTEIFKAVFVQFRVNDELYRNVLNVPYGIWLVYNTSKNNCMLDNILIICGVLYIHCFVSGF